MFRLFKKKEQNANISETLFECQRDGLTIRGTEYRPAGENLPIAIVSHGFMAFQDTVRHYAKRAYQTYLKYNPAGLAPEQRVTLRLIEDGAHGFFKKHDKMAMEEIKKFVQR